MIHSTVPNPSDPSLRLDLYAGYGVLVPVVFRTKTRRSGLYSTSIVVLGRPRCILRESKQW